MTNAALTADRDLRYRRSWWAPWRRYAYMVLTEPKSDRLIAYFNAPFIVMRDGVERLTDVDETAAMIRDHLVRIAHDDTPWWCPEKEPPDEVVAMQVGAA